MLGLWLVGLKNVFVLGLSSVSLGKGGRLQTRMRLLDFRSALRGLGNGELGLDVFSPSLWWRW